MPYNQVMSWQVRFTKRAAKEIKALPATVQESLRLLVLEIEIQGPVRGNWKNYGKLSVTKHHCHIKSGRPTYVACWEVVDKQIQLLEVYYVGTHEKAPY